MNEDEMGSNQPLHYDLPNTNGPTNPLDYPLIKVN